MRLAPLLLLLCALRLLGLTHLLLCALRLLRLLRLDLCGAGSLFVLCLCAPHLILLHPRRLVALGVLRTLSLLTLQLLALSLLLHWRLVRQGALRWP